MFINCSQDKHVHVNAKKRMLESENYLYPVRKQTGHRFREGWVSSAVVLLIAADVAEVSQEAFGHALVWSINFFGKLYILS